MRFLFLLLAAGVFAQGAEFKLRWNGQKVEAHGFPAKTLAALQSTNWTTQDWQRLLSVHAEQSSLTDLNLPPVAGIYRVEKNAIRFEPRFPLEPGVTYSAVLRPEAVGAKSPSLTATLVLPTRRAEATATVSAIYPTADILPENLLKFYVHFSAPMSGGHIYDHISLRDTAGKDVELPFLEIDEELWNPDMTRLTLFLDPGRIKRGVRPLEEIGPSFIAGKKYTLTISKNWRDANGQPLKADFSKTFSIGEADREPPDPKKWHLDPPAGNSVQELKVTFNEPLDHGILSRTLAVLDSKNRAILGEVSLEDQERLWTFRPAKRWEPGVYQIRIPSRIEDLAGNNIGKQFDVDLSQGAQQITNEWVRLHFEPR